MQSQPGNGSGHPVVHGKVFLRGGSRATCSAFRCVGRVFVERFRQSIAPRMLSNAGPFQVYTYLSLFLYIYIYMYIYVSILYKYVYLDSLVSPNFPILLAHLPKIPSLRHRFFPLHG